MDERYEKAVEFANYRQTLNNQLQAAKVRAESQLIISKNGGTFVITESLISFVSFLVTSGQAEAVLLDTNTIPVNIGELEDFRDTIVSRYFEVTNDYLHEYEKIRKSRSVKKIVESDKE